MVKPIIGIGLLFFCWSCDSSDRNAAFNLLENDAIGIDFINQITENDSVNVLAYTNVYTGAGVAVGDLNNDGLPDLYFGGNQVSSALYLNQSNPSGISFQNITQAAGVATDRWVTGVTILDLNGDGWNDIYACVSGSNHASRRKNYLFLNQGLDATGIPRFKEVAEKAGLEDAGFSMHAAFFDADGDGDLDVFIIENFAEKYFGSTVNIPVSAQLDQDRLKRDKFFLNEGIDENGIPRYRPYSDEAGIIYPGYSLGLGVSDVNNDGLPDIYVANDFLSDEILYLNQGDISFKNIIKEVTGHTSFAGMGVDIADLNNDGKNEILVLDMMPESHQRQKLMMGATNYDKFQLAIRNGYHYQYGRNTLQLNNGVLEGILSFSEVGQYAGLHHTDWSWAPLLADFDNDGLRDAYITNGFLRNLGDMDFMLYAAQELGNKPDEIRNKILLDTTIQLPPLRISNYAYKNQGEMAFENVTSTWGLERSSVSHGAIYADLDQDGDLEIIVSNNNEPPFIYENQMRQLHPDATRYLQIKLEGLFPNTQGIGTKVTAYASGHLISHEQFLSRGFCSSGDPVFLLGLGTHEVIDSLIARWPTGKTQKLIQVKTNQHITLREEQAEQHQLPSPPTPEPTFQPVNQDDLPLFQHQEYDFVDFHYQILLPHKHSQLGPGIAVGDVDGNGEMDLYIGGAKNQKGVLLQQHNSKFIKRKITIDSAAEDMGAIFFDADLDQDPDLLIASGSSEYFEGHARLQNRLYLNDGRGNFRLDTLALPKKALYSSCVKPLDYDGDGDIDLFIGTRMKPGRYPQSNASQLLKNQFNESGVLRFKDVTSQLMQPVPEFMVSDALWTDINQDGKMDLMIAGEFTPIYTYIQQENHTFIAQDIIEPRYGWWNALLSVDVDQDGDLDYIAGNYGTNARYKASSKTPLHLYADDFDENGSLDPLIFYATGNQMGPAPFRDDLISHMPSAKTTFLRYHDYAQTRLETFYLKDEFEESIHLFANEFRSMLILNNGDQSYSWIPLPAETQYAPVFGMTSGYFNEDEYPDLVLTGNMFGAHVDFGKFDASIGYVLIGDHSGGFKVQRPEEAGIYFPFDMKGLTAVPYGNTQFILGAASNGPIKGYAQLKKRRLLTLQENDIQVLLHFEDGRIQYIEPHGMTSYLSQASKQITIPTTVTSAEITSSSGQQRIITF